MPHCIVQKRCSCRYFKWLVFSVYRFSNCPSFTAYLFNVISSCNIFQEDSKGKPWTRLLLRNRKTRKLPSSPSVWKMLELPSILAEMKNQNPTNYRPIFLKNVHGLLRYLLEVTSSEVFKVNVWLSSFKVCHCISYSVKYLVLKHLRTKIVNILDELKLQSWTKCLSIANGSDEILEESDNWSYVRENRCN